MSVKTRSWLLAVALVVGVYAPAAWAGDNTPDVISFGALKSAAPDAARAQAEAWLTTAGRTDAATKQQFAAIWDAPDAQIIDRLSDTFALGDAKAAQLLADARDAAKAAPKDVPALLKDKAQPAFYRANLAL